MYTVQTHHVPVRLCLELPCADSIVPEVVVPHAFWSVLIFVLGCYAAEQEAQQEQRSHDCVWLYAFEVTTNTTRLQR